MSILGNIRRFFFQKASSDFDANEAFRRNQLRYNALYALDPDVLVRHLSAFQRGDICGLERVLEEFEAREDKMRIGAFKMAAAVSGKPWEVRVNKGEEDNPRAALHRDTLTRFWGRIEVTDAFCRNRKGGLRLLVKQMMEAQSRVYSVHDIAWRVNGDGTLDAFFTHVPAWCFENRTGRLRHIRNDGDTTGEEMRDGEWLVTVGEGVGIAAAVLAMAKRLSWNDWLLFSEKCGMPVVMGNTSAQKGTPAWAAMERAIKAVAPKTGILADLGTKLQAVSMGSAGQETYRSLVDTVDRAISALYRGGDLATLSSGPSAAGVNAQQGESELMDADGCAMVSETLRDQVERFVVRFVCGDFEPLAGIVINPPAETADIDRDIKIDMHLAGLGVRLSKADALARYGRTEAKDDGDALEAPKPAPQAGPWGLANEKPDAQDGKQAREAVAKPLQNARTGSDGETPPPEGAGASTGLLRAFAEDTAPAAAKIKSLLERLDAGEDIREEARKVADELPELMRGEPAMAAVLAEEMARAFVGAVEEGETHTETRSGGEDVPLANSNSNREKDGKFAEAGTGDQTGGKSGYTKEHREKVGQRGDYKSLGLPPLRDIPPDEPMGKTKIAEAKARIVKGESITDPLGESHEISGKTIDHWKATKKSDDDIAKRLQALDEAERTIEKPHEIWKNPDGKGQAFIRIVKSASGKAVVNVAEKKDGTVSWHLNDERFDYWRKGVLAYVR